MKLVVNSWIVVLVEGLAETLAFAESIGVDPAKFLEVIDGGPLGPAYAQIKGKAILEGTLDDPSFALSLAAKDVGLVVEAATEAGTVLPLTLAVRRAFERADDLGHGDEDMAAVYHVAERGT